MRIKAGGHVQALDPAGTAVAILAIEGTVVNEGLIASRGGGVRTVGFLGPDATWSTLTNSGTIEAAGYSILRDGNEAFVLVNSGLISGNTGACRTFGLAEDNINNTGRMVGNIDLGGGNDVYNGASGRLTGKAFGGAGADSITGGIDNDWFEGGADNDILRGNAGNDWLNGGSGVDQMLGGAGNDVYVVDNAGDIVSERGVSGIDTVVSTISFNLSNSARVIGAVENLTLGGVAAINGTGNALANVITGNAAANVLNGLAGNDVLNGLAGHDQLYGSLGNDRLNGGIGNDTLYGGAGNDIFVFNAAPSAANRDIIADFANAAGNNDRLYLDNAVFAKLTATGALNPAFFKVGTAAADASDYIVYNRSTGALFYDSNGSGAGGAIQFATLTNHAALTAADFVVI